MTTPMPAPDISHPVSLQDFFARVGEQNPFTDNRITGPSVDDVDVEGLQQTAFEQLTALAREALQARRGLGVVVWGEAGIGKSHLLSRLGRWATADNRASLVYLHNLQASPANLPRALLRAVVNSFTWSDVPGLHHTPLAQTVHTALRAAVGSAAGFQTWGTLERALVQALGQHSAHAPADAALADRTVQGVLFQFYRSIHRAGQRKEDGSVARLAVRWLRGDALSPDEGQKLGLPPARTRDGPVVLEDNQQIKQVLVSLADLAAACGRPFLLCFDQVDNLEQAQFSALARFLEALIDSARNLLVVTAGIQSSLLEWRERRVIQDSAWDRLAQFKVALQRLEPAEARPLIEKRLQRFLAPFEELPPVRYLVFEDNLFPLGKDWYEQRLAGRDEVRPRDVLNEAREGWYHEQVLLAREGGQAWLAGWKARKTDGEETPPTIPLEWSDTELLEAIDHTVDQKMAEYMRAAAAAAPDPDSVSESVAQLLEQCRQLDTTCGLLQVDRLERTKTGTPPTYNLMVRQRGRAQGTQFRTGLVFVPAMNAYAMFHVLDRLLEDRSPPQRILLIADEHGPDLGTKGEEHLGTLRERRVSDLKIVRLPLSDFATLDAMHAIWNMAKSEDLEVMLPDGSVRPVTATEVEMSHHRKGRYRSAPVLSEVFAVPDTVVASRPGDTIIAQVPIFPLTLEEIQLDDDVLEVE